MTLSEVMKDLESCGTAQNRKIYSRYGGRNDMFGVSYANLYRLQKKLKVNHELAQQLWGTRNHDAQVLATLIADPQQMTDKQAEAWAKEMDNRGIMEMLMRFMSRTPLARKKAEKWHKSKEEWIGSAGWVLIGQLALNDSTLPDEYFYPFLEIIESEIHKKKNFVRYEMNGALIAIGLRNNALEKKALAVAKKVGKVEVDHGETDCKTPDATTYIAKVIAYRHRKKAKAASKA